MDYISGEILTPNGFKTGYIGFEKQTIIEAGNTMPPKKPICKGLIVPTFINAHTHIGDSFIRDKNIDLPKNVEELVAPPNGLKHRLLKDASEKDIVNGMKQSIEVMINSGTSCFCDFRENGIQGINQLKNALKNKSISEFLLSRPANLEYNKEEVDILLSNSNGIGLSSISDWDYSELEKISKHTKKNNKIFAIHASERIREDIDMVLDLKADFLIHMVKASESDLTIVKENNIPIVLCPRSNSHFGLKPNLGLMKKIGVEILLGTDNAMLNSPNVLDELKFLNDTTDIYSLEQLLNMITFTPRKVLNLSLCILGPITPADFIVLDKNTLKTLYISRVK